MNLSDKIEELKGKMSYREMAEKTGVSHNYLRNLIVGIDPRTKKTIEPSSDILKRIAQAFPTRTTYEELLILAGYIERNSDSESKEMPKDLKEVLDSGVVMSYDGKPLTEEDMEILKSFMDGRKSND